MKGAWDELLRLLEIVVMDDVLKFFSHCYFEFKGYVMLGKDLDIMFFYVLVNIVSTF